MQDLGHDNGLKQSGTYVALNHVLECNPICHMLAKTVSIKVSPIGSRFVVHVVK